MLLARHRLGTQPIAAHVVERHWLGFLKIIEEGGEWPRGYGYAWREPWAHRAVCAPLPFNWLLGLARSCWFGFKCGPMKMESALWNRLVVRFHDDYPVLPRHARIEEAAEDLLAAVDAKAEKRSSCALEDLRYIIEEVED